MRCTSCGEEVTTKDRFCGECGEPVQADPPSPQDASAADHGEKLQPRANAWLWPLLTIGGLVGAAFVVYFGMSGFQTVSSQGEANNKADAAATDNPEQTIARQSEESEAAGPESADQDDETDDTESIEAAADAAEDAIGELTDTTARPRIAPGIWTFRNEMIDARKADPRDTSYTLSRQHIGSSQTTRRCISREVAEVPNLHLFPIRPEFQCQAISYNMSDGRITAQLRCPWTGKPKGTQLTITGRYTEDSVSLNMEQRIAADMEGEDPAFIPDIINVISITGQRQGPC